MGELTTVRVELARVVLDERNPRTHDPKNLAAIRASLVEHGQVEPLILRGMESEVAIREIRAQVRDLPPEARRLVVTVGGGMTIAGILHGLADIGSSLPVLGVCVGGKPPVARIDRWGPKGWKSRVTLVSSGLAYEEEAPEAVLHGVRLDPIYEAKAIPFLQPGDLFWLVGIRASAAG